MSLINTMTSRTIIAMSTIICVYMYIHVINTEKLVGSPDRLKGYTISAIKIVQDDR